MVSTEVLSEIWQKYAYKSNNFAFSIYNILISELQKKYHILIFVSMR